MELFEVYLQSGLFGSVIIVLTILLRYFLKQAPRKYLCILWLLAALRLLLPFHLESALSLQPYYEEPETVVSVEQSAVPPEIVTQERRFSKTKNRYLFQRKRLTHWLNRINFCRRYG